MNQPVQDFTHDWIQSFSGLPLVPERPTPDQIKLVDIARALSNQCRFTGHSKWHYSTAQHSILASYLCAPADSAAVLLHDSGEYMLNDLAKPTKMKEGSAWYREVEERVCTAVYAKFGIQHVDYKDADNAALYFEVKRVMQPHAWPNFDEGYAQSLQRAKWAIAHGQSAVSTSYWIEIPCLTPDQAWSAFTTRARDLGIHD